MSKIIEVSFPGGKRVDADMGGTIVRTDQPERSGGEGSAPEPFQLFLASIATCAGIYALGFCQARNIPTNEMKFTMTCDFDVNVNRYTKMNFNLKLPPEFPEKLIGAVKRSIDLCAVKRHMIEPPEFEILAEY
jgi:ribosomal protein S12 methylthiotransferase accessory factor